MPSEADAAGRIHAQWGRVNPRVLGDVVGKIRVRMEEGTCGHQTLGEQMDCLAPLTRVADAIV